MLLTYGFDCPKHLKNPLLAYGLTRELPSEVAIINIRLEAIMSVKVAFLSNAINGKKYLPCNPTRA
jgi:hypothetical protein